MRAMRIVNVFLLLALSSVARAQTTRPTLSALPARPAPGAVVRLALSGSSRDSVVSVSGTLAGEALHFARVASGQWHAIGGIPTDAEGRVVARGIVHLASGALDTVRATMTLPPIPKVKAEPLAVDSSFSKPLDAATTARIARENATARAIGEHSHGTPRLWTKAFIKPRESVITSMFGSGRVFNGAVTSRHLGVDYRGAVGDPIVAANRGVVALVDTFFLAGRVVYIDHGEGVVTAYFHMSEPLVQKGDTVERGQKIGLVGQTGRVTGPHLHWSARFGTVTVNPNDLIGLGAWFQPGD